MLGSRGPTVRDQRPASSLVNFGGGAAPSQSAVRVTSEALGALMRKVTRWSEWTSGETTGAGRWAWSAKAVTKRSGADFSGTGTVYALRRGRKQATRHRVGGDRSPATPRDCRRRVLFARSGWVARKRSSIRASNFATRSGCCAATSSNSPGSRFRSKRRRYRPGVGFPVS